MAISLSMMLALTLSLQPVTPPLQPAAPRSVSSAPSSQQPCTAPLPELCADVAASLVGTYESDGIVGVEWQTTREPDSARRYTVEVGEERVIDSLGSCDSGARYHETVVGSDGETVRVRVLDRRGRALCEASTVVGR